MIFDDRNELNASILVGKVYLDAQNGQFLQILYHVEDGHVNIKFWRKRMEISKLLKIRKYYPNFTFLVSTPTNLAMASSILPSKLTFY